MEGMQKQMQKPLHGVDLQVSCRSVILFWRAPLRKGNAKDSLLREAKVLCESINGPLQTASLKNWWLLSH